MKRIKNIKAIGIIGIIVLCSVGFVAYNLSNAPKKALEKQVMAMTGLKVDLSFEQAKAYFNGKDSVYTSLPKKKLVVFVDSTSCSSCFISHLTEYFEINDTLQVSHAELVIILHPQQARIEEVSTRLQQEKFPFRCIVDSGGEFIRKNQNIPSNQLLHSFLLDVEDKIALIGNPTRNQRIKELLYKRLQNDAENLSI